MLFKFSPQLFGSALIMVAVVLLAACNDGATGKAEKTAAVPVSIAAVASQATGFAVGSQLSTRTFYIFFDAQCPHCGVLWNSAKPLKTQAKFVWIPVGIVNASSTAQGATILASADPAAAMDKHEVSLMARQGGIGASSNIDAQKAAIAKNTELMSSFGFTSIPVVIGTNAQTGARVQHEGSMQTEALAKLLGLQMPSIQPVLLYK